MEIEHVMLSYPDHVKQAIHSLAWDRGHSAGLSEVHNCYYEITDFVDKIMVGMAFK